MLKIAYSLSNLQRSVPTQPKTSEILPTIAKKIGNYPTPPLWRSRGSSGPTRSCSRRSGRRSRRAAGAYFVFALSKKVIVVAAGQLFCLLERMSVLAAELLAFSKRWIALLAELFFGL